MKTIYESYLELKDEIKDLDEKVYKEEFFHLFESILNFNEKIDSNIFKELNKCKNYKEKYFILNNFYKKIFNKKRKNINYLDDIVNDYNLKLLNL